MTEDIDDVFGVDDNGHGEDIDNADDGDGDGASDDLDHEHDVDDRHVDDYVGCCQCWCWLFASTNSNSREHTACTCRLTAKEKRLRPGVQQNRCKPWPPFVLL